MHGGTRKVLHFKELLNLTQCLRCWHWLPPLPRLVAGRLPPLLARPGPQEKPSLSLLARKRMKQAFHPVAGRWIAFPWGRALERKETCGTIRVPRPHSF